MPELNIRVRQEHLSDPRDRELAALYEVNAALREQLNATQRDRRCMIREIGRLRAIEAEAKRPCATCGEAQTAQPQPPAVSKAELRRMVDLEASRLRYTQEDQAYRDGVDVVWRAVDAILRRLPDAPEAKPWRAYVVTLNISGRIIGVVPSLRALLDQESGRVRAFRPVEIIVTAYGRSGWVEEVPACRYSRDGRWLAAEEIADE